MVDCSREEAGRVKRRGQRREVSSWRRGIRRVGRAEAGCEVEEEEEEELDVEEGRER